MPVRITRYLANDGSEWKTMLGACDREQEIEYVGNIMRLIPLVKVPSGKFYQHNQDTLLDVRRRLYEMTCEKFRSKFPELSKVNADAVFPMAMCRYLDGQDGPIMQAWNTLCSFNFDNYRQYDQAYFAMHPEKAIEEMK